MDISIKAKNKGNKINLLEVEIGTFEHAELQQMFKNYNEVLKNYGKENVLDFNTSWNDLEEQLDCFNSFKAFLFKNEENDTIGFTTLQEVKTNEFDNEIPILYLCDFYISPKYRRHGLGTLAVHELIKKYGTRLWFWYAIKENKPAIKFWNRISSTLLTPVVDADCKVSNEDNLKDWTNKYVAAPSNIWDECIEIICSNKKNSDISKGEALNLLRNYFHFVQFADNSKIAEELVKEAWVENTKENK